MARVFAPEFSKWGDYPFLDKKVMGQSAATIPEIKYAQGAFNALGARDCDGKLLKIDGQFGKRTHCALVSFQAIAQLSPTGVLDKATWDVLDYNAYNDWTQAPKSFWRIVPLPRGPAITVGGVNRHTRQPVNKFGLTREASRLMHAIQTNFPKGPTRQNYAVDRAISGGTSLSDHARGEALDMMVPKYDGVTGISTLDRAYGRSVMAWIVDHAQGKLQTGLRGKYFRGPYRISYVLFDGWIWYAHEDNWPEGTDVPSDGWIDSDAEWMAYAAKNEVRRLKPTSNQHRDHVHVSIVPVDRRP